jgi:hypothetical protein
VQCTLLRYFHVHVIIAVLTFSTVSVISAYEVGVDYHATGTRFGGTAFITQYHIPTVRSTVRSQLQGIVDRGATFVSLRIWFVADPGPPSADTWRATFPMSAREMDNLHQYAQDVASMQSTIDGHRLRLDVCLFWLGAADYTIGNPTDGLGYSRLTASQFTSRVESTVDSVLQALRNVKRPDGVLVVETVYLEGELMIGAKANQDWFLLTHYPRFLQLVTNASFTPSLYFQADGIEHHVFQPNFIDYQFPVLNGRPSMYWVYRSVNFLKTRHLPLPSRIDFSCYLERRTVTYAKLINHILNDASATLTLLGAPDLYGAVETHYLLDDTERKLYGQAFATEALSNPRLERLSFWTTPNGAAQGVDVAYPFAIEDFLPQSSH